MKTSYCASHLIPPKSDSLPIADRRQSMVTIHIPPSTTFTKWGKLSKESIQSEDVTTWLYREDPEELPSLAHIPTYQYGKGFTIM